MIDLKMVFSVLSMWESIASLEGLIAGAEFEESMEYLEARPDLLNPASMLKQYKVIVSPSAPADQEH